jgi:hypothetical protein
VTHARALWVVFVDCKDSDDELLELFTYLGPCLDFYGFVAGTP